MTAAAGQPPPSGLELAPRPARLRHGGVLAAGLLALAIFLLDTLTPTSGAVAVLHGAVVLAAARWCRRRELLAIAAGCALLTVLSYLISHGLTDGEALLRALVSLAAIGITSLLALRNQHSAEALLEQARLLDLTHDSIFVRDMRDTITYWNRGAEALYGWPREQALGRPSHELLRTTFPLPLPELMQILLRQDRWEGELRHQCRDGHSVTVASRWSLQRDAQGRPRAILETNTDITERKRADQELRQSEERFRNIFQTTRIGIWEEDYAAVHVAIDALRAAGIADLRQYLTEHPQTLRRLLSLVRVVDVNETAMRLVQAESKAQLLASLDQIFLPETDPSFVLLLDALARGLPHLETETTIRRLDGTPISILMTVTFPPAFSRSNHVLVGIIDITERARAQSALLQAQSALAHVNRVATLGEMTASIAHEVNQPLAAIVTSGEACLRWLNRREPELAEARAATERVIRDGRRASAVVARIRAMLGKAAPRLQPVSLQALAEEAVLLLGRELQTHQVTLQQELKPYAPLVLGDRIQLQQVVINLLLNGAQAMAAADRPGVARDMLLRVAGTEDGQVMLTVRDSGPGIPPETLSSLFTAFYSTKPDGMGMGLSICRSVVEAHGGQIRAESPPGEGATLIVTLPAYRGAAA